MTHNLQEQSVSHVSNEDISEKTSRQVYETVLNVSLQCLGAVHSSITLVQCPFGTRARLERADCLDPVSAAYRVLQNRSSDQIHT